MIVLHHLWLVTEAIFHERWSIFQEGKQNLDHINIEEEGEEVGNDCEVAKQQ